MPASAKPPESAPLAVGNDTAEVRKPAGPGLRWEPATPPGPILRDLEVAPWERRGGPGLPALGTAGSRPTPGATGLPWAPGAWPAPRCTSGRRPGRSKRDRSV